MPKCSWDIQVQCLVYLETLTTRIPYVLLLKTCSLDCADLLILGSGAEGKRAGRSKGSWFEGRSVCA